jgi:hypothetical protein
MGPRGVATLVERAAVDHRIQHPGYRPGLNSPHHPHIFHCRLCQCGTSLAAACGTMFLHLRVLATALIITCSVSTVVSAGDAFSDFTRTWNGRRVVVRNPLYSVLYDEVGRMGRTDSLQASRSSGRHRSRKNSASVRRSKACSGGSSPPFCSAASLSLTQSRHPAR